MKGGAPRRVGELLVSALPQLQDRLLVQQLQAKWPALVGHEVARRTQPQGLANGCLHVTVDNSPWLHEMTLRAPDVAARVGVAFPAVRSIRFCLGPPRVEDPPPAARPAPVTLIEEDRRAIDAAAAAISDRDLAASARRLLTRAWSVAPRGNER